jgi:hypothetical protein
MHGLGWCERCETGSGQDSGSNPNLAIDVSRQFEGRSRPFPPKAVLGPGIYAGFWEGNTVCLTDMMLCQPRLRDSCAASQRSPVNRADRDGAT